MSRFNQYIENRNAPADTAEASRDIKIVMNRTLQQIPRVNGYGIDKIDVTTINEEQDRDGSQINLEISGEATAKNRDHVIGLLQKLTEYSKKQLLPKMIFLEVYYHKLNVSEAKISEAYDETPMGLNKKLYFNVVGAALVFKAL